MKRSERLAQLKALTRRICPELIEHSLTELAEQYLANEEDALRLKWTPEEKPLPERLYVDKENVTTGACPGYAFLASFKEGTWGAERWHLTANERKRVLTEAARRYNAWPELRRAVERYRSDNYYSYRDFLADLLAILDGKEPSDG